MARISYSQESGWTGRRVEKYGPLLLDPATAVLHYAQEIFEGLKAYRHPDGSVWTFRPQANAARFARSARRLALPELTEADFLGAIQALVATDRAWVPSGEETSLYLRPFMYASESFLGVRPSLEAEFLVIASPVGPYFAGGVRPVAIWVDQEYHRAGAGGTGAAKCGGNYAASLLPQQEAYAKGFEQVCFLDASTNTQLEELGGMNVFVVHADGSVATPPISGSILEGVTRSSILRLLTDAGHEVSERPIPLTELAAGLADGSVREVFACGTAAVVTPDRPPGQRRLRPHRRRRRGRSGHHAHPRRADRHPVRARDGPARLAAPPGLIPLREDVDRTTPGARRVTRVPRWCVRRSRSADEVSRRTTPAAASARGRRRAATRSRCR